MLKERPGFAEAAPTPHKATRANPSEDVEIIEQVSVSVSVSATHSTAVQDYLYTCNETRASQSGTSVKAWQVVKRRQSFSKALPHMLEPYEADYFRTENYRTQ